MSEDALIAEAIQARENAVATFSNFKVGSAISTPAGRIFRGCNVENSTLGLTVCAERVALLAALAAGERSFDRIAVITQSEQPSSPCGACRQLLWEFCDDIEVVIANLDGNVRRLRLAELLPEPFVFKAEEK